MMYEKECKTQTFIKIIQSVFCFVTSSVIFFFLTKSHWAYKVLTLIVDLSEFCIITYYNSCKHDD